MDLTAVNTMNRAAFTNMFGGVFEYSPWVAEKASHGLPFAAIEDLYQAMFSAVRTAPRAQIIQLLCAHPDLAGKEAEAGTMTTNSVSEQSSAGLTALSAEELQTMRRLNVSYRAKHAFPFIIAVRNYSKQEIFNEFERRLQNDTSTELANNIEQIFEIVRMRLDRIFIKDRQATTA